ncbi:hypothetical protein Lal_00025498 [Lupinus albus]|nr:hypothetical protein Lal_00025498 [Lupinus albus]
MFSPIIGLAQPLNTPQPVVCGQFPSSQSPTIGNTKEVSSRISWSLVKNLPHWCLSKVVKSIAPRPNTTAQKSDTNIAILALLGLLAPNSFPTLVETPRLSEDGNT